MKTQMDLFNSQQQSGVLCLATKQKTVKMEYQENTSALEIARKIKHGCRLMGLTRGQFSLIDLIYAVLQQIGSADVICATWSAGIKDTRTVKWMMDTELIRTFLIVTDHSYVTRQPKYQLQITELFGKENIRTTDIHAKFVLIQNEQYNICIKTSMNLNANKTCENYEIDEDTEIYNFYKDFILTVAGEMPSGFVANTAVVNRALDRSFYTLKNQFAWQKNE